MSVTLTQVAKESGVSLSLVSRLINRDPKLKVADATRQRVMEVHRRLGGRINTRAAVRKQCRVVVPINQTFASRIETLLASPWWQALETVLKSNDGRLTATFIDHDRRKDLLHDLIKGDESCDAILFLNGILDAEIAEWLNAYQFPHVSLSMADAAFHVNTICGDPYHGVRLVVRHLIEAGHQRIGYLGPRAHRFPILVGEMMAAGISLEESLVFDTGYLGDLTPQNQRQAALKAARDMLEQLGGDLPSVVICHNDTIAFGLMDAMKDVGLKAGKDVAVVGYDDIESQGHLYSDKPILTTVRNPFEEIGRHAAQMFLEQVQGGRVRIVHEYVSSPIIIRDTSPRVWPS